MGCGVVVPEVTAHFSSVLFQKNGVGIENMRQEEFVNTRLVIVLVHTATDIHAENPINSMGTSG